MNHLVRRSQVGSLLRILPCRFSFFRFPKTVSFPFGEFKNEEDLLSEQEQERKKKMKENLQTYSRHRTKLLELRSIYNSEERDGQKMEPEGIPIHKMLASYISSYDLSGMKKFLNKLEEKRPKGFGLAMLRKSEPLLVNDEYYDILGPKVYWYLMLIYRRIGEKEDLRRLWNLAKDRKVFYTIGQYTHAIKMFRFKDDIEGVHEVLEEWYSGEHRFFKVEIKDIVELDHYRKLAIQATKSKLKDMLEDHKKKDEIRKKTAMEVRQNGWDPSKNLALSAYACVQYVEGRTDIESAVDVLRLLGKREPQGATIKPIMDKDELSRKMVEAMRGGGYVGEV